jgi:hypothetical protein
MTSTTTRIITTALAILALAAPVASAMPMRDGSPEIRTSSLAGTTSAPERDMRNPDNQAPVYIIPQQQPQTMAPVHHDKPTQPAVATDDSGTSPLVYILPGLALVGMLGAAIAFTRTPRRTAA